MCRLCVLSRRRRCGKRWWRSRRLVLLDAATVTRVKSFSTLFVSTPRGHGYNAHRSVFGMNLDLCWNFKQHLITFPLAISPLSFMLVLFEVKLNSNSFALVLFHRNYFDYFLNFKQNSNLVPHPCLLELIRMFSELQIQFGICSSIPVP